MAKKLLLWDMAELALLIISSCELHSEYPTTALASLKVTSLLSLHHINLRDQSLRFKQKRGTRSCEAASSLSASK